MRSEINSRFSLSDRIKKMDKSRKIQLFAAIILTALTLLIVPTYAWFSYTREMSVSTKIDSPATLEIKSGGHPGEEQDIINFELSDIDTENATYDHYTVDGVTYYYKDFVFCVKGKSISTYDLQLAHTTNIAFKYQIYTAVPDNNGSIVYMPKNNDSTKSQKYRLARIRTDVNGDALLDSNDEAIYDDYSIPLDGSYVNVTESGNRIIAKNGESLDLTSRSYDTGDNFQKYANPAYWIKRGIVVHSIQKQDGGFTHSYVLRISWIMQNSITESMHESNLDVVQNNKETDVIYITAKARS